MKNKLTFRELRNIARDVRDSCLPKEETRKFVEEYNKEVRRDRASINFLLWTLAWGGYTALACKSPTQTIANYCGLNLALAPSFMCDTIATIAGVYLADRFFIKKKYAPLYPILQLTAENERARKSGKSLPHDEDTYNPQNLQSLLASI